MNVINEDIQHVWSDDNIKEARADLNKGPIFSVFISLEGNRRLTPLPRPQESSQTPAQYPLPLPLQQTSGQSTNHPSTSAKLISEVAKIYTEEQKYDGTNGSLDHKLTIFKDICSRVELPEESLMKAFPTILKGLA